MYKFSQKNKRIIYSIIISGLILILYKWIHLFFEDKEYFLNIFKDKNLWISLYVTSIYFTSLSIGSLVFLGIQNISKSGWSIIIHPIMEKIASFIPYGTSIIFTIILLNSLKLNGIYNIFQWMDPNSSNYNIFIHKKKLIFNIPFFLIRNFLFLIGYNFFYFRIKNISKKLNFSHSLNEYNKLYSNSILFIIFFSITSVILSWDWIMFLNPHWFSTLFGWYFISSFLVTGIGIITIISILFKENGILNLFKKDHLHDLSKYLFSSSLLWTYFWFSQFLLYWYGNIPEEISYFLKRENIYNNIHLWLLIPNFLIPFFLLINSKNKTNPKIVLVTSIIILMGHYMDIYNLIVPELNGKFQIGIYEIGIFLMLGGFFCYILLLNFNKKELNFYGNPFFKESKNYKNPNI
ncbi:hypothetical protein [Blattabacterium cuenoti]|uniref:hypothetical protein n=1 Tax=Blattabacterium cuenoti TaxID=1653831 RepID=UPI00163C5C82|nr:hypothetical protein [Blattabacterium cuenoti]